MTKSKVIPSVIATIAMVSITITGLVVGQSNSEVPRPPVAANGPSAEIRQERLRQLLSVGRKERVALLRTWVMEEYKATKYRAEVEKAMPGDSEKAIDDNGIQRLIEVLEISGEEQSVKRDWLLLLVTALYSETDSIPSRQKIVTAFDGQYRVIMKMDSSTVAKMRSRLIAWNTICLALRTVGNADLLTDDFWKALESCDWRDAGAVACLANAKVLEKLQSYKNSSIGNNVTTQEKIGKLIKYSRLLIENPQIKDVSPGLDPVMMDRLVTMEPKSRKMWIQQELDSRSRATSKPSTLPVTPTSRSAQPALGQQE